MTSAARAICNDNATERLKLDLSMVGCRGSLLHEHGTVTRMDCRSPEESSANEYLMSTYPTISNATLRTYVRTRTLPGRGWGGPLAAPLLSEEALRRAASVTRVEIRERNGDAEPAASLARGT